MRAGDGKQGINKCWPYRAYVPIGLNIYLFIITEQAALSAD